MMIGPPTGEGSVAAAKGMQAALRCRPMAGRRSWTMRHFVKGDTSSVL